MQHLPSVTKGNAIIVKEENTTTSRENKQPYHPSWYLLDMLLDPRDTQQRGVNILNDKLREENTALPREQAQNNESNFLLNMLLCPEEEITKHRIVNNSQIKMEKMLKQAREAINLPAYSNKLKKQGYNAFSKILKEENTGVSWNDEEGRLIEKMLMKKLFKEWLLLKHCSDTKSTQNADGDSPEPLWKNDGKASLDNHEDQEERHLPPMIKSENTIMGEENITLPPEKKKNKSKDIFLAMSLAKEQQQPAKIPNKILTTTLINNERGPMNIPLYSKTLDRKGYVGFEKRLREENKQMAWVDDMGHSIEPELTADLWKEYLIMKQAAHEATPEASDVSEPPTKRRKTYGQATSDNHVVREVSETTFRGFAVPNVESTSIAPTAVFDSGDAYNKSMASLSESMHPSRTNLFQSTTISGKPTLKFTRPNALLGSPQTAAMPDPMRKTAPGSRPLDSLSFASLAKMNTSWIKSQSSKPGTDSSKATVDSPSISSSSQPGAESSRTRFKSPSISSSSQPGADSSKARIVGLNILSLLDDQGSKAPGNQKKRKRVSEPVFHAKDFHDSERSESSEYEEKFGAEEVSTSEEVSDSEEGEIEYLENRYPLRQRGPLLPADRASQQDIEERSPVRQRDPLLPADSASKPDTEEPSPVRQYDPLLPIDRDWQPPVFRDHSNEIWATSAAERKYNADVLAVKASETGNGYDDSMDGVEGRGKRKYGDEEYYSPGALYLQFKLGWS